jgi:TonB family protein
MMALSLVIHLAFFLFVLYGQSFWGPSPGGLQSYQVSLVSPLSVNPSSPSRASSAPPSPSLTPSPTSGVQTASAPRPSSPSIATPKPLSPKAPPVKEDPERLQDWWQKKAKSIKIPPIQQPKNDPAPPTPAQTIKGPMANPAPAETDPTALQKEEAAGPALPGGTTHPGGSSTGVPGQAGDPSSVIATGSVAVGGGGGGGLLNASLFKFPFYLKNIENKISGQWSPPPSLLQQEMVDAIVQFNVTRRGVIESIEIEKSSGNSQFDQAALRAIYNANPLPPLPEGLTEDSLKVHFSFTVQRGS